MTPKISRYGVPMVLSLAMLGLSACANTSPEDLGENGDKLQPCEYAAQCTTAGSTCHYGSDSNNGALTCNADDPLNKYYGTSCEPGMYCQVGDGEDVDPLYETCTSEEDGVLYCDGERRALVQATCGDGVVTPEAGEVCDDGNTNQCTGACNQDCTVIITGCQDGVMCGVEACDDGDNVNNDGCDANCTIPGCGNGAVGPGEDCDDGNLVNGDACDNNCTFPGCMNGALDPDELCDDGNDDNGDGCDNNCTVDECGNGIVVIGEQCDDGNDVSGDGCQSNCQFPICGDGVEDPGEDCDLGDENDNNDDCDELCNAAICGDGYVQGSEECDDGNEDLDDDCNPGCILPECGDGRQDANEECDDGDNTPGDGCSSVCTLEEACVDSDEDPDCLPEAYGCRVEGETCPYDADGAGGNAPITLECLCPNVADDGKGSWEPEGTNCDDIDLCWVPGGVPSLSESCPGEPYTITLNGPPVVITGTTVGAADDMDACFGSPSGAERVYHLTLTGTGTFRIDLTDDEDLDSNVVIGSSCATNTYCWTTDDTDEHAAVELSAGEYWFTVESEVGTAGAFEAVITLTSPDCGDGVLNTGEACDEGPAAPNDGCVDPGEEDECTYEAPNMGADICPGESIDVPVGVTNLSADDYTTNGYTDDYRTQNCFLTSGGADRIFQLMPEATGTLTAIVGLDDDGETSACLNNVSSPLCWDYLIYARTTCTTQASELACDDSSGVEAEEISFPVTTGVPVSLFIDGYDNGYYSQGPFNLRLTLVEDEP